MNQATMKKIPRSLKLLEHLLMDGHLLQKKPKVIFEINLCIQHIINSENIVLAMKSLSVSSQKINYNNYTKKTDANDSYSSPVARKLTYTDKKKSVFLIMKFI